VNVFYIVSGSANNWLLDFSLSNNMIGTDALLGNAERVKNISICSNVCSFSPLFGEQRSTALVLRDRCALVTPAVFAAGAFPLFSALSGYVCRNRNDEQIATLARMTTVPAAVRQVTASPAKPQPSSTATTGLT